MRNFIKILSGTAATVTSGSSALPPPPREPRHPCTQWITHHAHHAPQWVTESMHQCAQWVTESRQPSGFIGDPMGQTQWVMFRQAHTPMGHDSRKKGSSGTVVTSRRRGVDLRLFEIGLLFWFSQNPLPRYKSQVTHRYSGHPEGREST